MIVRSMRQKISTWFGKAQIATKILVVIMLAVIAALAASGIALIVGDRIREKSRMEQSVSALAQIVASNSTAALVFRDTETLNETLALLNRRYSIIAACIYDDSQRIAGLYIRENHPFVCPSLKPGPTVEFLRGEVWVREPIVMEKRQVGTLLLVSDLREMQQAIRFHIVVIVTVLIFALFMAYILSRRLRHLVSGSLLKLIRTAQLVSEKQDYSIRAETSGEDELSILTDAFNHMLSRIEQYNRERERLLNEAQEGVRARDEFMYIASHELNTPITPLKLQVQFIRKMATAKQLTPEFSDKLETMLIDSERHIAHLAGLVENLLDVTRIASGQFELELEPVDLNALIQSVVKRYHSEITASRSEVTLQLEEIRPGLWDRTRVEQVIVNLLENALKYGEGKPIVITSQPEGEKAVFAIRDHGIGISAEEQSNIFKQFGRAVPYRHFGGLGLGLYITLKIIRAHQGDIRVESQPGQGSRFTVELPLAIQKV
ncbi:MAG TPA: ATP-binding protein [Bdellovibrionota bacterium]|nr:ATP-binding protein [Bdellovibrionota bacterium]